MHFLKDFLISRESMEQPVGEGEHFSRLIDNTHPTISFRRNIEQHYFIMSNLNRLSSFFDYYYEIT